MGRLLRWLFFASLSVIMLLQLRGMDGKLITPDTPYGIVGYELAFTAVRADAIIAVWRSMDVIEAVKVSLGFDVFFLLVYPWFFRTSVQLLRRDDGTTFQGVGQTLAGAVLACLPLDALENALLWRMLDQGASPPLTVIAGLAAALKFLLVLATGLWCLVALSRRVIGTPSPASR
jgi:hypothetical protein